MREIFATRRFGQFSISARLMHAHPEMVQALLSHVIVFHCEYRVAAARFDYDAWSAEFPELLDGCPPTTYHLIVDHAREYVRFCDARLRPQVILDPWEAFVS